MDEEIEDLPDNMPAPLEWVLAEATLDVPLHRLHHVIFDQNSKFMTQFCNAKKYTEVKVGPWAEDGTREFKSVRTAMLVAVDANDDGSLGGILACLGT